jgi:hypothetical protein
MLIGHLASIAAALFAGRSAISVVATLVYLLALG